MLHFQVPLLGITIFVVGIVLVSTLVPGIQGGAVIHGHRAGKTGLLLLNNGCCRAYRSGKAGHKGAARSSGCGTIRATVGICVERASIWPEIGLKGCLRPPAAV